MTLTDVELDRSLTGSGWHKRGDALVRELWLKDFEAALDFVEKLGNAAVDYGRRPDLCISEHNRVRLSIGNPHHVGFTQAEVRLLEQVNAFLADHPPHAFVEERRP
jgi:pterin-4a-carbinolamine dehydratase